MLDNKDNFPYYRWKFNKDSLNDEIKEVLDLNMKKLAEKICSSEELSNKLLDYYFFLNLYLSFEFLWVVSQFFDQNGEVSFDNINELKEEFTKYMKSTDQWILNLEKLWKLDSQQLDLLSDIINSVWDFNKFWNSVFDRWDTRMSDILQMKWYSPDDNISAQQLKNFMDAVENMAALLGVELLEWLKN